MAARLAYADSVKEGAAASNPAIVWRGDTCWGDEASLQAAADMYGRTIKVVTSAIHDRIVRTIKPQGGHLDKNLIWLSYWADEVAPPPPPPPKEVAPPPPKDVPALEVSPLSRTVVHLLQTQLVLNRQLVVAQQLTVF